MANIVLLAPFRCLHGPVSSLSNICCIKANISLFRADIQLIESRTLSPKSEFDGMFASWSIFGFPISGSDLTRLSLSRSSYRKLANLI